jgi:hypothetical protein
MVVRGLPYSITSMHGVAIYETPTQGKEKRLFTAAKPYV